MYLISIENNVYRKGIIKYVKVLLCSYFKYPNGDAGSVRHEKLAVMLKQLKHEVLVVGLGVYSDYQIKTSNEIDYVSLRLKDSGLFGKIKTRLNYWINLKRVIESYHPDVIIMDDMRPRVTIKIKAYCKKNSIRLVHDSVEWYSHQQFKLSVFSPAFISKNIMNRFLIDKTFKVIAISQYLTKYYKAKGIHCINIPIVISNDDLVADKELSDTIQITYAGQAGKKDYIDIILSAMALLSEDERRKLQFHIIGCSLEQIKNCGISKQTFNTVLPSLKIWGRVPRETVLDQLKKTDFTILIRSQHQRYAKAGFPTKAVESLSHSTPIIANITSDLALYLEDGYNAFIVRDCSVQAVAEQLKLVINTPLSQRKIMCEEAYFTAKEKLHYEKFLNDFEEILK